MSRIWPAVVLLCLGSAAGAQCRPEGRPLFAAGLKALAEHDLAAAAGQFSMLVGSEPGCVEARNNLAAVEAEQGRLAEAAHELRAATQSHPEYLRARSNLQRVDTLLSKAAVPTATSVPPPTATSAPPTPIAGSPTPTMTEAEVTATPAVSGNGATPAVNASVPQPPRQRVAGLSAIAVLEPEGATACSIDRERRQVCLYTRAADGIASGECYPMAKARMASWPQWVIAGQMGEDAIRLRDETGRVRFSIAPDAATVRGDAVWLARADFDALAAHVVPAQTGFVLLERSEHPADPMIAATIQSALQRWRSVWEQKRYPEYLAQYSESFLPQRDMDLDHWRAHKRHLFEQPGAVSVQITAPSIFVLDDGATAITVFERWYRSPTTVAHDLKALRWQRQGDDWKISAETVLRQNLPDQIANR